MSIILRIVLVILCISFTADVFAAKKITSEIISSGVVSSESSISGSNTGVVTASGSEEDSAGKQETDEEKKDREKTINDINTFLIESYKLKIDRILTNLNLSIERVTNNDPVAQAKLLEKIRGDISTKVQVINSRNISSNRKKILSSIFSYIQENLDAKISHLVEQK